MSHKNRTYIDGKDYPLYRQWWIDHYDEMIKQFGKPIMLFPLSIFTVDEDITPEFIKTHTGDIQYFKDNYDFPIWSTTEIQDKWLVKNCSIPSFRDRLLEVYPSSWEGFKGVVDYMHIYDNP